MKIKILIFLILQEIFFRIISPIPEANWFNRARYEHFIPVGQGYCPMHYTLISESSLDNFKFNIKLNSHGFRGKEFKVNPDKKRVIFIGDSFVEGWGANDNETISQYFEKHVKDIEAINLGITGSGPERYLQILEDSLPLLKPDGAFIILSANDFPTKFTNIQRNKVKRSTLENYIFTPRILLIISQLFNKCLPLGFDFMPIKYFQAIPDFVHRAELNSKVKNAILNYTFNPYMISYADKMEKFLKFDFSNNSVEPFIKKILDLTKKHSVKLTIAYIPYSPSVNDYYSKFQSELGSNKTLNLRSKEYFKAQEHISKVCNELNIPFLDFTNLFIEKEKKSTHLFWPYDAHCNSKGYNLIAEMIGEKWLQIQN